MREGELTLAKLSRDGYARFRMQHLIKIHHEGDHTYTGIVLAMKGQCNK